jgi:hypothetical protein
MNLYLKNDIYKKLFNKVYEKYSIENNEYVSERLNKNITKIESCFNQVLDGLSEDKVNNFQKESGVNSMIEKNEIVYNFNSNQLVTILQEQLENMNKINSELNKIIKDNFPKLNTTGNNINTNNNVNNLSRENSEAVLLDKDDFTFEFNNLNENSEKNKNETDLLYSKIDESISQINNIIKKIYELTKPVECSSKLIKNNKNFFIFLKI